MRYVKLLAAGLAASMIIAAGCGSEESAQEPSGASSTSADTQEVDAAEKEQDTEGVTQAASAAATQEEQFTDYSGGFSETVNLYLPVFDRSYAGWDPTDNYWTRWIQRSFGKKYNVDVHFIAIDASDPVTATVEACVESPNPTVLMHYDYPNMVQYNERGLLQTIDPEELAFYAPDYWEKMQDTIETYGMADGNLRFLMGERKQTYNFTRATLIRKDWLDAIGVSMPTTLEEYDAMMPGIRSTWYGYDTIEYPGTPYTFDLGYLGNISDSDFSLQEDGAVAALPTDQVKAYLKEINSKYRNGWLLYDFCQDTDGSGALYNFAHGQAVSVTVDISADLINTLNSVKMANANADVQVLDPAALVPSGNTVRIPTYPPFGLVYGIASDAEDEERIAFYLYLNWLSDENNLKTLQYGTEGVNYRTNEDGTKTALSDVGEQSLSFNDNKDYWCFVTNDRVYDSEEERRQALIAANAPEGYEYLLEDAMAYNEKYAAQSKAAPVYSAMLSSVVDHASELSELWKTDFQRLTTEPYDDDSFDTLYEELSEEYSSAGYSEILEEKQTAIDAGNCHGGE